MADARGDRPLQVLVPYRELRPTTNPYIVQLHRALERTDGVEPVLFSYGRAFRGGYDVVHLHWPETLLAGRRPVTRVAHRAAALAFLLRTRLARVPLVRTVHNLELPTGLGRFDTAWLRLVERWTTLRVTINETTPLAPGLAGVTVLHGHYRDWFASVPRSEAVPGRLAYAGLVRRYKNVDGLVRAFRAARAADPTLSLHVAGNPSSEELARSVRDAAEGDEAVRLDLRFLDDAALVDVVTSAELVVLPYRHMHNSGTALLALSLDRPVLVPDNATTRALATEVGPGWVQTFTGELDAAALRTALERVRADAVGTPDLSAREWDDAGRAHRAAYRHALHLRRGR